MCGQHARTRYLIYKDDVGFLVNAQHDITGFSRTVSGDKSEALTFRDVVDAQNATQFVNTYDSGFEVYDWGFDPKSIQFEYIIKYADMFLVYWKSCPMSADNEYTFGKLQSKAIKFPNWNAARDVAALCGASVMAVAKK